MNPIRSLAVLLFSAFLTYAPVHASATSIPPLAGPPIGERWFSIAMGDQRTGFDYSAVAERPGGYELAGSGSAKMVVLGFSRQAAYRASYLVNRDLSLRSFVVEQIIDGKPMRLVGKTTARGVTVTIETGGESREKVLKAKGPVYPPSALNLYPLMKGVVPGKKYRVRMFDPEDIKVKEVKITALNEETLPDGTKTVHLRNDLYPFVDNDIWIDLAGNTIKESVRDGLIDTREEPASAARRFILDAALAKRDLILDYSLVRTAKAIEKPVDLKKLTLELAGFPDSVPVMSDERQKGTRLDHDRVNFSVSNQEKEPADSTLGTPDPGKFLKPTDCIPSDRPEVISEKERIVAGEKDPLKELRTLVGWVAGNIGENRDESPAAVELLTTRKGDCLSHARLYAALARAAGIPTRVVEGLVYLPGKGFLFHSWAESYVGHWLAVDPTLGQVPADVTHVKLAEGDAPEEMAVIVPLIGRLRAKILEERQ